MKTQKFMIALTIANAGMLLFSLAQPRPTAAQDVAPVLRGHALEIVDDQGVSARRLKYSRHNPTSRCLTALQDIQRPCYSV